jgi:hypothetical protein
MKQRLAFSFFLLALLSTTLPAQTTASVSAKALAIHNSAIIVDTHADTPQRFATSADGLIARADGSVDCLAC